MNDKLKQALQDIQKHFDETGELPYTDTDSNTNTVLERKRKTAQEEDEAGIPMCNRKYGCVNK